MQKLLNQEEIDEMVRLVRGSAAANPPAETGSKVAACDFRQAAQLRKDQVRAISGLHETFARNLTHWLAAYLRVGFECNLVSVEQLKFEEIMSRVPEVVYLSAVSVEPSKTTAALQLELSAAFPIIDLLLGGPGRPGPQRDLTAIEEQILEDVVRIICRELGTAWQPIGVTFEYDQRLQPEQLQRVMPLSEMTLALSFEIRIAESQGTLNLVFPSVVSDALLRKLAREFTYQKRRTADDWRERLAARLMQCPFEVELAIASTPVAAADLVALTPGQVLMLPHPVDHAAILRVAGQDAFEARVVRREQLRAAHLQERIATSAQEIITA